MLLLSGALEHHSISRDDPMTRGRSRTGWMVAALSAACVAVVAARSMVARGAGRLSLLRLRTAGETWIPSLRRRRQRLRRVRLQRDDPAGRGRARRSGRGRHGRGRLGARRIFLDPCINDTDCTTNLCFPFNAYGPHCSMQCSKDTDCPAPSPGCSGMGVCESFIEEGASAGSPASSPVGVAAP